MLGAHRGGQDELGEDIVVTAKMAELKQCLLALGGAGLEGFIDPIGIAFAAGKSVYEARGRADRPSQLAEVFRMASRAVSVSM